MKRQLKQLQTAVTRLGHQLETLGESDSRTAPPNPGTDHHTPTELMTPRETLRHRLDQIEGDRIKQQTLVDELDWSESTISRHLSDLEAEGTIERYQIGRENVVFIEDSDLGSGGDDTPRPIA